MAYRTIFLTLGELRVVDALLASPKKADLTTARSHASIRSSLSLRQSTKDLSKLNEKGQDLNVFRNVMTPQGAQPILLQWDDMLDPEGEILTRLAALASDVLTEDADSETHKKRIAELRTYSELVADFMGERECSIPEDSLRVLSKLSTDKDWNKMWVRDRMTGVVTEKPTNVPPAQLDIWVNLVDKITDALREREDES